MGHTPNDCVQGIIIRPLGTDSSIGGTAGALKLDKHYCHLSVTQVPKTALGESGWQDSPLSATLGVPVKVRESKLYDSRNSEVFNHAAQLLMLEPDPEDDEFGSSVCGMLYGDQLVVRADWQSLGAKNLKMILRYVQEELGEVKNFWKTEYEDRKGKAKELAGAKLTVEAFKAFK